MCFELICALHMADDASKHHKVACPRSANQRIRSGLTTQRTIGTYNHNNIDPSYVFRYFLAMQSAFNDLCRSRALETWGVDGNLFHSKNKNIQMQFLRGILTDWMLKHVRSQTKNFYWLSKEGGGRRRERTAFRDSRSAAKRYKSSCLVSYTAPGLLIFCVRVYICCIFHLAPTCRSTCNLVQTLKSAVHTSKRTNSALSNLDDSHHLLSPPLASLLPSPQNLL